MEIVTVQKQIKENKLNNLYVFTGDELEVQKIYINKIIETSKLDVIRCESVLNAFYKMTQKSFVTQFNAYLIYNDYEFIKTEDAWQKLVDTTGNNLVILVYSELDKRSTFYKEYKDIITEFTPLSKDILIKYINKQINLSVQNCEKLVELCENNYSRILLEINKIKCYGQAVGNASFDTCFEQLLRQGAIYVPPKDAIFELCDSVCKGYRNRSFELYEDCKAIDENPLAIITLLYNNLKQILQVQSYLGDPKNICNSTGLASWQIKLAKEKIGAYSVGELVSALKLLKQVETGIKIGDMEQEYVIDYIMVNLL